MEEGYIELVNAIILQAFKDYRNATRRLRRDPTHPDSHRILHEVETFCHSDWFQMLTDLDGDWILERIKNYGIIYPYANQRRNRADVKDSRQTVQ